MPINELQHHPFIYFLFPQIDLIDMRNDPDGEYKWIGHFMDHFSKFHVFFPLHDKSAPGIAKMLRERVFSVFGLPYIVQSDNGREFVNKILEETVQIWPGEAVLVNGRPRHPQSQGLVEQGNYTLERMIAARKEDSGETNRV